ncbi:MAG: hypothetical protein ACE5K9_12435 [Candidatus Methylomirabilales bacterium]
MEYSLIVIVVAVTSLGAFVVGVKGLSLPGGSIRYALGKMLECVGLTFVFLVVNVGLGVVSIFAARVITQGFVSLYLFTDETLLGFSLFQALTFRWWLGASALTAESSR